MTDPVDTDTLRLAGDLADAERTGDGPLWRAAATEMDRLRNAVREYSKQLSDAGAAESRAYAERDRLRAVIENAPHAFECPSRVARLHPKPCTCWKADAL